MLVEWAERPQDVANLLNPAFDGLLLHRAADGYEKEAETGMPFELMFLVLPFVLHESTRRRLPRVTTQLTTWLQGERDILLGFADRATDLVPYTQEGILYLTNHGLLRLDEDGRFYVGSAKFRRGIGNLTAASEEVRNCHKVSLSVGKWLALSGSPTTMFALLGIKP